MKGEGKMEMKKEIVDEVERLAERYLYLKENCGVQQSGLDEKKMFDTAWIKRVCQEEGYDPKPYLNHYEEKINGNPNN